MSQLMVETSKHQATTWHQAATWFPDREEQRTGSSNHGPKALSMSWLMVTTSNKRP